MNKLAKIESTQLEEVVKNSGLQIQEGEEIKKSYIPYLNQLAEIQEQSTKINYETPAQIDEMIAHELRMKTVKIRTGAGLLKDDRKRIHLLKGNLEQAAFNLIAASCKLAEESFTQVEKAREIAAEKAAQELKLVREKELEPYREFLLPDMDLAHMDGDTYQKILKGGKLQLEFNESEKKRLEAERIEREKEQERIRIENEKLKKEAEAKEQQIIFERKKAEAEAEKARQLAEAKLKKEREDAAEKLRIEQAKAKKLQDEIKAKQEAEMRAKKEAEAKAAEELKARQLAEKKAKAAPDKQKLIAFSQTLKGLNFPEMKSDEGVKILMDIQVLMQKLTNFIDQKATEL